MVEDSSNPVNGSGNRVTKGEERHGRRGIVKNGKDVSGYLMKYIFCSGLRKGSTMGKIFDGIGDAESLSGGKKQVTQQ